MNLIFFIDVTRWRFVYNKVVSERARMALIFTYYYHALDRLRYCFHERYYPGLAMRKSTDIDDIHREYFFLMIE